MNKNLDWPYNLLSDVGVKLPEDCDINRVLSIIDNSISNMKNKNFVYAVYRDGKKQVEVARDFGVTKGAVHQTLKSAILNLRYACTKFTNTVVDDLKLDAANLEKITTRVYASHRLCNIEVGFQSCKYVLVMSDGKTILSHSRGIEYEFVNTEDFKFDTITEGTTTILCEVVSHSIKSKIDRENFECNYTLVVTVRPIVSLSLCRSMANLIFDWFNGIDLYDCCPAGIDNTEWFQKIIATGESIIDGFDCNNDCHKELFIKAFNNYSLEDILYNGKDYTNERFTILCRSEFEDPHCLCATVKYRDGTRILRSKQWIKENIHLYVNS